MSFSISKPPRRLFALAALALALVIGQVAWMNRGGAGASQASLEPPKQTEQKADAAKAAGTIASPTLQSKPERALADDAFLATFEIAWQDNIKPARGEITLTSGDTGEQSSTPIQEGLANIRLNKGEYTVTSVQALGTPQDFRIEPTTAISPTHQASRIILDPRTRKGGGKLKVLDNETGKELNDVIVELEQPDRNAPNLPGPPFPRNKPGAMAESAFMARGPSPITLDHLPAQSRLWVHSPGYTWAPITNHPSGKDLTVRLHPSGNLFLRFPAPTSFSAKPELVTIELQTTTGTHSQVYPAVSRVPFRSMPAGDAHLRVSLAPTFGPALLLIDRDLEIPVQGDLTIPVPMGEEGIQQLSASLAVSVTSASLDRPQYKIRWSSPVDGQEASVALTQFRPLDTSMSKPVHKTVDLIKQLQPGPLHVVLEPFSIARSVNLTAGETTTLEFDLTDVRRIRLVLREAGGHEFDATILRTLVSPQPFHDEMAKGTARQISFRNGESLELFARPGPLYIKSQSPTLRLLEDQIQVPPLGEDILYLDCEHIHSFRLSVLFKNIDGQFAQQDEFEPNLIFTPIEHTGRYLGGEWIYRNFQDDGNTNMSLGFRRFWLAHFTDPGKYEVSSRTGRFEPAIIRPTKSGSSLTLLLLR